MRFINGNHRFSRLWQRFSAQAGLCVLMAGHARGDSGQIEIRPRVSVSVAYDSNYLFSATEPISVASTGVLAGVAVTWLPNLRWRLNTRHEAGLNIFAERPAEMSGVAELPGRGSRSYSGGVDVEYWSSLATRLRGAGGGFLYAPPRDLAGAESNGGWGLMAFEVAPFKGPSFNLEGGVVITRFDAVMRRDTELFSRLSARLDWRRWTFEGFTRAANALSTADEGNVREFTGGAGAGVRLWSGATLSSRAGAGQKHYSAAALYAVSRKDLWWFIEAGMQQRWTSHGLSLRGRHVEYSSNYFPFERNVLELTWDYEPAWLF